MLNNIKIKKRSKTPTGCEITLRVVLLSIFLAVILAIANTYLALKIGILASASIPAAILSMGILKFFKNTSIYEHNLVQTAASAGEAIAGGIVFTIPALIILNYWQHFPYVMNFCIALLSSFAGIFLSVPLRRYLLQDSSLKFPEGRAIAAVLQSADEHASGFKEILQGSFWAALLEAIQSSQIFSSSITGWTKIKGIIIGGTVGFSAILVSAGYLMGWDVSISMLVGSILAWGGGIPLLSVYDSSSIMHLSASDAVAQVLTQHIREMGVSTMIIAGLFTLAGLLQPLLKSIFKIFHNMKEMQSSTLSQEKDLPFALVLLGLFISLIGMTLLVWFFIPLDLHYLHFDHLNRPELFCLIMVYLLIAGAILSGIAGYFSGLVGVTASPGSSIVIAGMLLSAVLIKFCLFSTHTLVNNSLQFAGAALAILLGSLLTGMAAISNDNLQDLKVGQLIGATPWKQQLMLLLGALVASLVVPWVMEVLFQAYGIANILPHGHMNSAESLPAPPAAIMAMLVKGVFNGGTDWDYFLVGSCLAILLYLLQILFKRFGITLSILAMAVGVYLPMSTSTALFIGGVIAKKIKVHHQVYSAEQASIREQRGYLIACGAVVGAIIMDIFLIIPNILGYSNILESIHAPFGNFVSTSLGFLSILLLSYCWIKKLK